MFCPFKVPRTLNSSFCIVTWDCFTVVRQLFHSILEVPIILYVCEMSLIYPPFSAQKISES